ncbi:hypothetical protein FPV67DRAFT_1668684 [Lyophyllum atratum]|nr:hypothetical protein FPV67DRAFT_1668684 [Lyophyllum atratum]
MERNYVVITKSNFLKYYHQARTAAFKESTILAAWRKTGIQPFNRNAILDHMFAPSRNTTNKATPIVHPSHHAAIALPAELPKHATANALRTENEALRQLLEKASDNLLAGATKEKLLALDNERLRQKAFTKKKSK